MKTWVVSIKGTREIWAERERGYMENGLTEWAKSMGLKDIEVEVYEIEGQVSE